ncbi:MAG: hypothetical protein QW035_04070 [Candidatus Anstonellales archaeon]
MFLREKRIKILLLLLNQEVVWYPSLIARKAEVSNLYANRILKLMFAKGLITIESEKRKKKVVKLTDKGAEVAKTLEKLKELLQ